MAAKHCRPSILVYKIRRLNGKIVMAEPTNRQPTAKTVTLRLNRQQLELIDRTVARGVAPDRASLVRLALKEYAASRNQPKQRT